MTPSLLVAASVETVINGCLRLDSEARPRVAPLHGKVIAVEFVGLGLTLYLLPGSGGIRVVDSYAGAPDVLISGTPLALARLARGGAADVHAAGVRVQGDARTGKAFQTLLKSIDIDWEEQLSHWVGDVAAHQVGKVLRETLAWGHSALHTLERDVAEYLREEARDLPSRDAVEGFLNAVDTLRSNADRLEARIRRLRQAAAERPHEESA